MEIWKQHPSFDCMVSFNGEIRAKDKRTNKWYHRICDTCMIPIEVKNTWNEKETKNG